MGFYINELEDGTPLPRIGKADFMLENIKATHEIGFPTSFSEAVTVIGGRAIIAIVENGNFDAAAYVNERMYDRITRAKNQGDVRKTRFIIMERTMATKLAGIDDYIK